MFHDCVAQLVKESVMTLPNCLSVLRGLCAIPFFVAMLFELWGIAFGILIYAIVSDLIDGPIARRSGLASKTGTRIDHTADATFVFFGLLALLTLEYSTVPFILPVLQLIAFIEYAYKGSPQQSSLLPSQLGKYNGIAYFVVIATVTTQLSFDLDLVPNKLIFLFSCLLTVATMLSLALRLLARRTSKATG